MKTLLLAGLASVSALALAVSGAAPAQPPGAQILTEHAGDALELRGRFTGRAGLTGELAYQFSVRKEGASGTSTSRQGGAFPAPAPGQASTVPTVVRLGVERGDRLDVTLTIRQGDRLIDEARLDTVLQR